MNPFLTAVFLSTLNTKIVDLVKQPILQRWPQANLWWFSYVSILTGLGLGWLAEINLLADYIPSAIAGIIITGLGIGAGSWFLYEVFVDTPDTVEVKTTTEPPKAGSVSSTTVNVSQLSEEKDK